MVARTFARPLFLRRPVPKRVRNTWSPAPPMSMGVAVQLEPAHWKTATGVCVPTALTRTATAAATFELPKANIDGITAEISTDVVAVAPLALVTVICALPFDVAAGSR